MSQVHQRTAALEDKLERIEKGNELMRRDLERPDVPASQSARRIMDYSANKRDPLVHADESQPTRSSGGGCCRVM